MALPSLSVLANAAVTGLLLGGLLTITALGLSLILGVMRLINLVHGELVILGSYVGWLLLRHFGIDPLLGMLLVGPLMFAIGFPLQRVLLTPLMARGPEGALLTTFGLSIVAQNLFLAVFSADTQAIPARYAALPLRVLTFTVPAIYAIGFALALLLAAGIHVLLHWTPLGRQIRAAAEDAPAAEMLGVNVPRVHAITYGLGAACAGIGGVLAGTAFAFTPTSGVSYLLTGFAVVVLGGLGSVGGTLAGGLLLGLVESVGGAFFGDGYRDFIGFVAFLVFLAVRPQGLFGRLESATRWRT